MVATQLSPAALPRRRLTVSLPTVDGIEITINGADLSGAYKPASLSINDELESRGTADFILVDATNTISPAPGQSVDIKLNVGFSSTLVFSGTIHAIQERWPTMDIDSPFHTLKIKAVDHNSIADRFLVGRTYAAGQLPGDVVKDLRTNYLDAEGVGIGNIEDGSFTLGVVSFNYESVADCLDDLAELIGFIWYIDHHRNLYFQARDTTAASFGYSDSSLPIRSLKKERTRQDYRNRQYLRAGRDVQATANTETFTGDGDRRTFTVGLPLGDEPTITLELDGGGAVAQTVGINGVDSGKDWYYQIDSHSIEQEYEDTTILTSSDTLSVTYKGLIPIIVQADLEDQQDQRADESGGSGIWEAIEDDERIEDAAFALERASGLLNRYGRFPEILSIQTDAGRLRAGQVQNIELDRESIIGEYLIQSCKARDQGDNTLVYSYKCVDGAMVGGWVAFFKKLAQGGRTFEIRDNEIFVIMREKNVRLDISDSATGSTTSGLSAFTLDPYSVFLVASSAASYADPNGSYIGTGWTNADGTRRAGGAKIGSVSDGS